MPGLAPGTSLTPAVSVTHQHLLAVVNTECGTSGRWQTVRLLDLGCGDGRLLAYLAANLPVLNPDVRFKFHGLDVHDCDVQPAGFLDGARTLLSERAPAEDWHNHLCAVSAADPWPFPDESFDVIVSNQVLEHVANHDFVFSEIARTLKSGGKSAHLFPLVHYFYEGHLQLPFVHRIRNFDALRAYIRTLSRFGLGKYRAHRRDTGISAEDFAERHADYMQHLTNYLTYTEALRIAKRNGLRGSFRYTGEFYGSKLRSLLRQAPRYEYAARRSAVKDWSAGMLLRYVSSITLFLEKRHVYRREG